MFMDMTNGKGLFLIMSDHGFTVLKKEVYINSWLVEKGFLKLNNKRKFYEQIDVGTKAFALDPARIYINLEEKFPLGCVKSKEKQQLIDELINALESLVDDGTPVIRSIYRKEDLYHGSSRDLGPDLVCLAHDGYELKGTLGKQEVFAKRHFTGMHTRHDAHCILPETIGPKSKLHIEDLSGIILDYFTNH
jgi:predicted AlkP superfamily phosphohydrolase/phosphomutase